LNLYNLMILEHCMFKNEIERFFRSKGLKVANWNETWDESNQTGDVIITLNNQDVDVINTFINLFNQEVETKRQNIHRDYRCNFSGRDVIIYSVEEKAVVELI
jgi:prophage tail gpP-like protein